MSHPRLLRYAAAKSGPLANNAAHTFAAQHALSLYRARAIYSFIPKNACSTMRYSIALDHGAIADESQFYWIHKNNPTFRATLPELITADYTFVILRCPFRRAASVYLDKIVGREQPFWALQDVLQRAPGAEALSFAQFVDAIAKPAGLTADIHWRPQIEFLVYEAYDDYFCVEDFASASARIEARTGVVVRDARQLSRHGVDGLAQAGESGAHAHTPAHEIEAMRRNGETPSVESLYTPDLIKRVRQIYADDCAFYRTATGRGTLF